MQVRLAAAPFPLAPRLIDGAFFVCAAVGNRMALRDARPFPKRLHADYGAFPNKLLLHASMARQWSTGMAPMVFGMSRRTDAPMFVQIGAPVLTAPSRLLGRSEERWALSPPGQERDHSGRDSG
jgi:hypothetical protein